MKYLSTKNNFAFDHVRVIKYNLPYHQKFVDHVRDFKKAAKSKPMMILKHHTYLNFTEFGLEQPTYINVVRHPVSQFSSFYYFKDRFFM